MKELLERIDKKSCLLTIFYKSAIYLCWYLFAIIFSLFIYDYLTDSKILIMIVFMILNYLFRNILKYLHNTTANDSYHNVKHNVELYYFKKIENSNMYLDDKQMENIDNMILDFSYRFTSCVFDLGEVIIPLIFGIIILYSQLFFVSVIMSIVSIIYVTILVIMRYKKISINSSYNYNDLLHEFISKFDTIRKLKIFDFCYKKLESNNDNDMVILSKSNEENDIHFSNGMIIYLLMVLLTIFFVINNNVTRIGLFIFTIVIMLKLQNLLYDLPYTLKNMVYIKEFKKKLDLKYKTTLNNKSIDKWNKVLLQDVKLQYKESNTIISIPNFELIRGDSIGILGKPGQGKSTVLNILSGLSEIDTGIIKIDDAISKYPINVVYVSPSVKIFNLSLKDNLSLGKKVKDEDLISLIKEIGLGEWYESLENGLDTVLKDESDSVVRRINIIRAIILNEDVYFFDEITLKLDLDTEKKVVAMIKKYFNDKTYIIISNRPILNNICQKHYFIKNHTLLEKESLL